MKSGLSTANIASCSLQIASRIVVVLNLSFDNIARLVKRHILVCLQSVFFQVGGFRLERCVNRSDTRIAICATINILISVPSATRSRLVTLAQIRGQDKAVYWSTMEISMLRINEGKVEPGLVHEIELSAASIVIPLPRARVDV